MKHKNRKNIFRITRKSRIFFIENFLRNIYNKLFINYFVNPFHFKFKLLFIFNKIT